MPTRAYWGLIALLSGGCALVEYSTEPDPAWKHCQEQPTDPSCMDGGSDPVDSGELDATLEDGGDAEADARVDAGMDARVDAAVDAATTDAADAADARLDTGPSCMCVADSGRPVCLQSTGQCVECTGAQQCGEQKPVCAMNQCVGCTSSAECSGRAGTPACNTATGACVQCTAASATLCTGATPVCDPGSSSCVACNVNADCRDPAKPTCENHMCRACQNDGDCSGKMNGGIALDACFAGSCVDCRIDTADTKKDYGCGGNVACNPATRTCTGTTKNSTDICLACVADSECLVGHRCVPLNFSGMSVGGYCMKAAGTGSCVEPYKAALLSKQSLSGAAMADYCGITEATTSCEAIKALEASRACAGGDAGACQARGALCATVNGGVNSCTYRCTGSAECPTFAPCNGPQGSKYCGGQ